MMGTLNHIYVVDCLWQAHLEAGDTASKPPTTWFTLNCRHCARHNRSLITGIASGPPGRPMPHWTNPSGLPFSPVKAAP
jgi:hypothetical protein